MREPGNPNSATGAWIANQSVVNVEPTVAEPARIAAPPPPPPAPHRSKRPAGRNWPLWVAAAVVLLVVAAYAARTVRRNAAAAAQATAEPPRTATVERKDFVRGIRVAGTVEAVASHPVTAPRIAGQTASTLVITALAPTGTNVHKGDLVVEFDRQVQIKNALDKEAEYNDFVQQINKLKATQAVARAQDDTDLKAAEDALATAELEIKRSEVESRIQVEKANENLDEARTKLKQLQDGYQLKRAADTAAVRVLEIQRDASHDTMIHAQQNADLMSVHAPADGLVVLNTIFKNNGPGEVQASDEVRPGIPFMQIVDPGAMRVRAHVNQDDMAGIEPGIRVEVRPDAYPQRVFTGHVVQLDAVGVGSNSSKTVHTFGVLFSIDGSDPKLLPDLSAAVDIELERVANALVVPLDALVMKQGQLFARVVQGNSDELRPVKLGPMNEVEAVIESGLQAGDVLRRDTAPVLTAGVATHTP
jgi:HlyD family secretion protein